MFGRRSDGTRMKGIDPIVALTPYIMPQRSDSQVFTRQDLDFDEMTRYIREQKKKGVNVTHMGMFIAAYVRMLCDYPEMNRFIVNKKLYSRNHVCVSFVTLRKTADDSVEEALCKVQFDLKDTIYDVSRRLSEAIENGRKEVGVNKTDAVARALMSTPLLPNIVVRLAYFMDAHGILPKFIHDASPFHTSLFITNMASIGMPAVRHHIYNFGTTTMFFSIGSVERTVTMENGKAVRKRLLPIGVTADERICAGAMYARLVAGMKYCLAHPSVLEQPAEHVRFEENNVYHVEKPQGREEKLAAEESKNALTE